MNNTCTNGRRWFGKILAKALIGLLVIDAPKWNGQCQDGIGHDFQGSAPGVKCGNDDNKSFLQGQKFMALNLFQDVNPEYGFQMHMVDITWHILNNVMIGGGGGGVPG